MSKLQQYNDKLQPPPRKGERNRNLLSICNYAVMAGLSDEAIVADVAYHWHYEEHEQVEIRVALKRARRDLQPFNMMTKRVRVSRPLPPPSPLGGGAVTFVPRMIEQGQDVTQDELVRSSPIPIPNDPLEQSRLFISTLYHPDELLFSGKQNSLGFLGSTVRKVSDWLDHLSSLDELISRDPLASQLAPNVSYREMGAVDEYRHLLVEFDNMELSTQIQFWAGVLRSNLLPVRSLVHSGGKSIHALLWMNFKKDDPSRSDYIQKVHCALCNPKAPREHQCDTGGKSRGGLTRTPGVWRTDKNRHQSLLWLSDLGLGGKQ